MKADKKFVSNAGKINLLKCIKNLMPLIITLSFIQFHCK